jgi:GNAT superfamily N-acetyltransferase
MDELKATKLIRLSIGIENLIDSSGDLRALPGKDSALFSISHHQTGYSVFFRYDLPPDVRRQIDTLDPEVALKDHETAQQILVQHTLCDSVFAGKGYYFAHLPSPEEFPDAVFHNGCYVIPVDGESVSWAWTANESEKAAELAVETAPEYRQRGYARQVVAAWAAQVLREGKVAFYSHEVGNFASKALAHSLGVVKYAVVTSYESKATAG